MLLFLVLACADPTADKPKAELLPPSAPVQPVAAPAAPLQNPAAAPGTTAPANLRAVALSGTVGFTGAKITKSHEGRFNSWKGEAQFDGNTLVGLRFTVQTSSVQTDSPKLDTHLASEDFFNSAAFPEATFVSSSVTAGAAADAGLPGATHTVEGELTLHNVKKQLRFPVVIEQTPTGIKARTEFSINRKDFGIVYPGRPDDLIREDVLLKVDIATGS
ncbi:MAG TPA: YceI family protein [Myxococcota bacterium]|nr:YceI family protein [Myxococcota bacterium]